MFEKQIARGMAWLDENFPGWVEKIVLENLNLGSSCDCVLGQTFGTAILYVLMIGFLLFRPSGLFGLRVVAR